MPRIIAGLWKGRRLDGPATIRPTQDKVRAACFNILGEAVIGARVLDLYAGTGALGLEALSRGAAQVTFVESEAACVQAIRRNIAAMSPEAGHRCAVLAGRATQLLARLATQGERFDLVFSDPPYDRSTGKKCLIHLEASAIINPCGWAVLEHAAQDEVPGTVGSLTRSLQRRYGDTALSFYVMRATP